MLFVIVTCTGRLGIHLPAVHDTGPVSTEMEAEPAEAEELGDVPYLVQLCLSMRREAEQLSRRLPARWEALPWSEECAGAHLTVAVIVLQGMAAAMEVEAWCPEQPPPKEQVGAVTDAVMQGLQQMGNLHSSRARCSSITSNNSATTTNHQE